MPTRRRSSKLWFSLDTDGGRALPPPLQLNEHNAGFNTTRPVDLPTAYARNEWPTLINPA
jgi:hypothetical protein